MVLLNFRDMGKTCDGFSIFEICVLSSLWLMWLYRLKRLPPIQKRSSSCLSGLVFEFGNVKVIDMRLYWIEISWSDDVFIMKSLMSFTSWAARCAWCLSAMLPFWLSMKYFSDCWYTFLMYASIVCIAFVGVLIMFERLTGIWTWWICTSFT